VGPADSSSFSYWFYPDPLLEPRDYVIDTSVDYSDEDNRNYTTVVYNKTVVFVEGDSELDIQTVFSYLVGTALSGLVIYVIYTLNKSKSKGKGKTTSPALTSSGDDWTQNPSMDAWKAGSGKSAKK